MAIIEIDGRTFDVDGDGFLTNPKEWNEEVAQLFAKHDGTGDLTEQHWAVVNHIRQHWEKTDMAPMVRSICQDTGIRLRELYTLFPQGPARGACKIAGLPKPDGCV
ncbi:TusE/DsrC/DsvC family sulfur relay protein [Bacteroidales bacterium OttesenSCG-928-K03]|nr:TusE/DsrC/DsvC family sulfur relay protein [Odoribacter sp. OttesenSCG-928-L07]MDL2239427.1 TusE/DsrC/DsvC family sulfur relay protein [Bacteroidales bacterium OttesenSCG-928-L14]MDL2241004.1 TusE/DsrC/DsvC family sulfur relay protein [Bacteroidales bacterium OttesenSCG-928-K22]MDL2243117.1 TusE/DsrC/DsvC family sulfur relay protein [Bacteroidales bacterium OttesenSCG-928-K03]